MSYPNCRLLKAEIKRLRESEEFKLVAFLSRPEICVGKHSENRVVVYHHCWDFNGSGDNVISAARMAMQMARKHQAAKAGDKS